MDNKQLLDIISAYLKSIGDFGTANKNDLVALIYLMFMKDFYEANRNISLEDMGNDEVGLTDDMVRALNRNLECIVCMSCLVNEYSLDEFPTKNHWMVVGPDDEGGDEPQDDAYIDGGVLHINAGISDRVLHTDLSINNKILEL